MLTQYCTRLAWTFARNFNQPRVHVLDEVRLSMRVWPTDIDVYLHLNNGRYLTLMDNGRFQYFQRSGLLALSRTHKWRPVLGAATVRFLRELKPLEGFDVVTRCAHWDEKWFFLEHRFEREGQVHAIGYVKPVFKVGRKTVTPVEVLAALGLVDVVAPEPSPELAAWLATGAR